MKIVWRGGRPFKAPRESSTASKKANGAEDAVIMLDSDDEGSSQAFVDKPEFEDEENELDPSKPYPNILQVLDLYLGTDVMQLALLPNSILKAEGASWRSLEGLKQKIVFTAACADNTVRLITLPITPPSPMSKARDDFRVNFSLANAGNGAWGETVVLLSGHQKPSEGLAMTVDIAGSSKQEQGRGDAKPVGPQIIVASHSREVTGLLLLYRVSISSPKPHQEPFQSILLSSPAKCIFFNPSLSKQQSSHLLVADNIGVCRIYDFKLLVKNSLAEESSQESLIDEQGTWLVSLYPGFHNNKSETQTQHIGAHAGFGRKTIVDAKWVSGGKAILVLLSDGEWGIWDIEGVGPGASQGLLGRQSIKGGSRSEFSLAGFIEGATTSRPSGPPQIAGSKFAPMTPGTRKSIEPFGSRAPSGPIRGQISVVDVPSTSPTNPAEESIVFWLGETFTIIPSLSKYWAANARKSANGGNLFNGTPGGRMVKLEHIDLLGERCSGVDQIVRTNASSGLPSDILILGEHRFTLLLGKATSQSQSSNRIALVEKKTNSGELDVIGIDQALARMESSNGFGGKKRALR